MAVGRPRQQAGKSAAWIERMLKVWSGCADLDALFIAYGFPLVANLEARQVELLNATWAAGRRDWGDDEASPSKRGFDGEQRKRRRASLQGEKARDKL